MDSSDCAAIFPFKTRVDSWLDLIDLSGDDAGEWSLLHTPTPRTNGSILATSCGSAVWRVGDPPNAHATTSQVPSKI